ncbi:MAG: GNAT family N-acetyltransferase [Saprospiraceae bacterium]|nr:GNAT family N-acetyltransferase [Saprospiraceae bacterium]
MTPFLISTDKDKLNQDLIWDFLSNHSYWARGCSRRTVEKSIQNSLCFGVYLHNYNQVGFARVVTDYATFGSIMDVFILNDFRGQGLAKLLLREIMAHPELTSLRRMGLNTRDAHNLYRKFGFADVSSPQNIMEILKKPM